MKYTPRQVDNKGTAFDTLTSFVTKPGQQLDERKNKANIWRESIHFKVGADGGRAKNQQSDL